MPRIIKTVFYKIALVVTTEGARKTYENLAAIIQSVLKTKNAANLASDGGQKTTAAQQRLSSSIYNKAVAAPQRLASQLLASEELTEGELNKLFGLLS